MSSTVRLNELIDEFTFLNELNVKASDAWYLLARFNQLEALILDGNAVQTPPERGSVLSFLMKKLKVLSLNKCNLYENFRIGVANEKLPVESAKNETKLFYMGLSRNKLGDLETSDLSRLLHVFMGSFSIVENLDLSANKFTKLDFSLASKKQCSFTRINFERNLIGSFNINDFLDVNVDMGMGKLFELNLRNNFIRNVNADNFKIANGKKSMTTRVSVKLKHNPLLCDCNSMWLFDEMKKYKLFKAKTNVNNNNVRKLTKNLHSSNALNSNENESNIKLIFKKKKREIEEISAHHNLNDPNFDEYMQRQKRIKFQQEFDQTDQTWVKLNKILK